MELSRNNADARDKQKTEITWNHITYTLERDFGPISLHYYEQSKPNNSPRLDADKVRYALAPLTPFTSLPWFIPPATEFSVQDTKPKLCNAKNHIWYHKDKAKSICRDCNLFLCAYCLAQHSKKEKFHFTTDLEETFFHPYEEVIFYCESCKVYKNKICQDRSGDPHLSVVYKIENPHIVRNNWREVFEMIRSLIRKNLKKYSRFWRSIEENNQQQLQVLQELEIPQQDFTRFPYLLSEYIKNYNSLYNSFTQSTETVVLLNITICANELIEKIETEISKWPQEVINYPISYIPNYYLGQNGELMPSPYPSKCSILRTEFISNPNEYTFIQLDVRDIDNQAIVLDNEFVQVECLKIENVKIHFEVNPFKPKYIIMFRPIVSGLIEISVKILGCPVKYSPLTIRVGESNVTSIIEPLKVIGHNGQERGQFERPWGVCCDSDNRLIVADRSNHRIQIIEMDTDQISEFGSYGTENGQFNLPIAVTVENEKRWIIVSDKENHRIQIFDFNGDFKTKFGQFGKDRGQLNYPWDVAVNSCQHILVSDSRNCRIQLFNYDGDVLWVFGNKEIFDNPRGVCFTQNNEILVSDFNKHCVVVIKDFRLQKYVGENGADDGKFNRPSGIIIDNFGNIVVVDSNNDRVQIFNRNWNFVHGFGGLGTNNGEFERPSDVAVTPCGYIAVVDFKNERVQLF